MSKISLEKYQGCFFGLALGDAFGAPYEGGPLERLLWRVICHTSDGRRRYTDDTQMSIDLALSLLEKNRIDQDHLAATFADSYRWSRGYGPAAGKLLKKIHKGQDWRTLNKAKYKEGSFGNGAAMRAPILALAFASNTDELTTSIEKASEITHAHPQAIEGATLIANATLASLRDIPSDEILKQAQLQCQSEEYQTKLHSSIELLKQQSLPSTKLIRQQLGNGISAIDSCVTALFFALKFRSESFDAMLKVICQLGGDTDTIGSMAGAIWGASNGIHSLNQEMIKEVENHEQIEKLANKLYNFYMSP